VIVKWITQGLQDVFFALFPVAQKPFNTKWDGTDQRTGMREKREWEPTVRVGGNHFRPDYDAMRKDKQIRKAKIAQNALASKEKNETT
jgi:hypothetical protein